MPWMPHSLAAWLRLLPLLAVLGVPGAAVAQPAPPPAGDDDQRPRAILDLVINDVAKGEILVVVVPPDIIAPVKTLQQAGLHVIDGRRQIIDNEAYVSLASLAPGVTFVLDEARLQVRLAARPELLQSTVLSAPGNKPRDLVYGRNTSAFLNYSIATGSNGATSLFAETGLSVRGTLVNTTLSRPDGQKVLRGLSNVTLDDRDRLTRWVVGDAVVNSGQLGGGLLLGGVTFAREYSVDPYFVRLPTLNMAGTVTTPSVVEIYANNQLVRREQIQPGQFEVNNLVVQTGRGDTRMVIRDAFGREREVSNSYYVGSSALARGLQEFSYSVGFQRLQQSTASWSYGKPAALGRHRVGLTDQVTLGYRFEATTALSNAGPLVNLSLPVGEIEVAGAVSRANGRTGTSAEAGYSYLGRTFGGGVSVTAADAAYRRLGIVEPDLRTKYLARAFANVRLGARTTISVQEARARTFAGALTEQASVLGSVRLTGQAYLQASVGRVNAPDRSGYEASVGVSLYLGDRTTASVGYERRVDASGVVTELQHPLPVGTGLGYRARLQTGANQLASGELQYQTSFGRYDLRTDRASGHLGTTATIAGGVVGIGGGLFFSRPVEQSYALIQVPDVNGVRTYASNQEVGKTDRHGNLLVPNLLAYYGNRLSIADQDVPLNHVVQAREITLAPPFRGGAVARFPVARIQGVTGTVTMQVAGTDLVPAYGELLLNFEKTQVKSPIGADGAFYFETLLPGTYTALIEYKGNSCTVTLTVPASDGIILDLGALRCVAAGRKDDQQ